MQSMFVPEDFNHCFFLCLETLAQIPTKHSSSKQLSILTHIPILYITKLAHTWHAWQLLALWPWVRTEKLWQGSGGKLLSCSCQHSCRPQWIICNLSGSPSRLSLLLSAWNAHELRFHFRYCCLYWNTRSVTFQHGLESLKKQEMFSLVYLFRFNFLLSPCHLDSSIPFKYMNMCAPDTLWLPSFSVSMSLQTDVYQRNYLEC